MPQRRYRQFCPLARALDVLGERWTLLLIRELMVGPRRYSDLRNALPGLATDLLATRLRQLQESGLIDRREVPPPTPATVYELTTRGRALKPVIRELANWGRPLLSEPADDWLPDSALLLGMETAFHPEAAEGINETYELEVDGMRVAVRVYAGTLQVTPGGAGEHATLRIVTDRSGFMELARGTPRADLQVEGDRAALARLQKIFSPT
ncbi:MAG: winged helix-turn-helix transcriptional regulator [Haloechinothrix sp.]